MVLRLPPRSGRQASADSKLALYQRAESRKDLVVWPLVKAALSCDPRLPRRAHLLSVRSRAAAHSRR